MKVLFLIMLIAQPCLSMEKKNPLQIFYKETKNYFEQEFSINSFLIHKSFLDYAKQIAPIEKTFYTEKELEIYKKPVVLRTKTLSEEPSSFFAFQENVGYLARYLRILHFVHEDQRSLNNEKIFQHIFHKEQAILKNFCGNKKALEKILDTFETELLFNSIENDCEDADEKNKFSDSYRLLQSNPLHLRNDLLTIFFLKEIIRHFRNFHLKKHEKLEKNIVLLKERC